MTGGAHLSG
jgi:hypothetical protein